MQEYKTYQWKQSVCTLHICQNKHEPIHVKETKQLKKCYKLQERLMNLRVAQIISKRLQVISRKLVLIPQHMVMGRTAGTLLLADTD